ncbi:MAG: tetratricopeptide repeat protein [Leptospirales bacterium]|nr:tetratricopeptide repeat protein [Leptospirales bacterium]
MKKWVIVGMTFIIIGIGLLIYYDYAAKSEKGTKISSKEAQELFVEGHELYQRDDKDSINKAIDIFIKVIAKYPDTDAGIKSYFYIAEGYEKLNLNRQAYLKYVTLINNKDKIPSDMEKEINVRIARLNIMKQYSEEGIHSLLSLLQNNYNKDFRSRIYTELGHTYLKTGDLQKSKKMFDLAMSERSDNEEAILGKARTLKRLGKDAEAYELYDYFLKYYGSFSNYTKDVTNSYEKQLYESGLGDFKKDRYYSAITFFKKYLTQFNQRTGNSLYMLGESYFALKQYDTAISYYKRVLSGDFKEKDQDAAIKIGHSYFMAKNFDLAAREFQKYIDNYPNGKYIERAKQWKEMCVKEAIYKNKRSDTDFYYKEDSNANPDTGVRSDENNDENNKSNKNVNYGSDDNIAEI